MVPKTCRIDARPACSWSAHGYKHFPFEGMTRAHTEHGPARYLVGADERRIKDLETSTARSPERWRGSVPRRTEYLRDAHAVIGWDAGRDATLSFVECAGSDAVRSFHGRPMREGNPRTRGSWEP